VRPVHPPPPIEEPIVRKLLSTVAVMSALALVAALAVAGGGASARATTVVGATAAAQTSVLRVEPLGDSITYGYQSSTGNGYRGPLWDELTAEGHPLDFVGSVRAGTMSDPDNEGHSGWRIDQIAGIADSSLATYKPNVVTLMIGTNDLGQNYQVSTAPARLNALVDQILRDAPSATVLVANLIVSTNTVVAPLRPAYNAAVAAMVSGKQAAGERVALVDMSALSTADLFDALHPNDGGYQKMADAWNTGIQAADAAGRWPSSPASPANASTSTADPMPTARSYRSMAATAPRPSRGHTIPTEVCERSASAST
jgi:lysophospholipase L1-like esterase